MGVGQRRAGGARRLTYVAAVCGAGLGSLPGAAPAGWTRQRLGRQCAGTPAGAPAVAVVGRPLECVGGTLLGLPVEWEAVCELACDGSAVGLPVGCCAAAAGLPQSEVATADTLEPRVPGLLEADGDACAAADTHAPWLLGGVVDESTVGVTLTVLVATGLVVSVLVGVGVPDVVVVAELVASGLDVALAGAAAWVRAAWLLPVVATVATAMAPAVVAVAVAATTTTATFACAAARAVKVEKFIGENLRMGVPATAGSSMYRRGGRRRYRPRW